MKKIRTNYDQELLNEYLHLAVEKHKDMIHSQNNVRAILIKWVTDAFYRALYRKDENACLRLSDLTGVDIYLDYTPKDAGNEPYPGYDCGDIPVEVNY